MSTTVSGTWSKQSQSSFILEKTRDDRKKKKTQHLLQTEGNPKKKEITKKKFVFFPTHTLFTLLIHSHHPLHPPPFIFSPPLLTAGASRALMALNRMQAVLGAGMPCMQPQHATGQDQQQVQTKTEQRALWHSQREHTPSEAAAACTAGRTAAAAAAAEGRRRRAWGTAAARRDTAGVQDQAAAAAVVVVVDMQQRWRRRRQSGLPQCRTREGRLLRSGRRSPWRRWLCAAARSVERPRQGQARICGEGEEKRRKKRRGMRNEE